MIHLRKCIPQQKKFNFHFPNFKIPNNAPNFLMIFYLCAMVSIDLCHTRLYRLENPITIAQALLSSPKRPSVKPKSLFYLNINYIVEIMKINYLFEKLQSLLFHFKFIILCFSVKRRLF